MSIENRSKSKKKMKTWKKTLIIVLSVLLAVVLAVAGVGIGFLNKMERKNREDFEILSSVEDERDSEDYGENLDVEPAKGDIKFDDNIKNILLIGVDAASGGYGRSDVVMLVSIDENTKKIKQTSFLRDTYLHIPGFEEDNRLNYAYRAGAAGLLIDTITENYKIRIDNYVKVDFESFVSIVEILGGVDIELSEMEAIYVNSGHPDNNNYTAGMNTLSAKAALAYCRTREIDSDFHRTERQRKFLRAVVDKFKGADITTIVELASAVMPFVQTDLSNTEIFMLATKAPKLMSYPIEELHLPFEGTYENKMIRGMAVLVPDMETLKSALWEFIYGIKA